MIFVVFSRHIKKYGHSALDITGNVKNKHVVNSSCNCKTAVVKQ